MPELQEIIKRWKKYLNDLGTMSGTNEYVAKRWKKTIGQWWI